MEPPPGLSCPTHLHWPLGSSAPRARSQLLLVRADALLVTTRGPVFIAVPAETMEGQRVFPPTPMPSEADRDNKDRLRAAAAAGQAMTEASSTPLPARYPPYNFGTASYYPPATEPYLPATGASVPSPPSLVPLPASTEPAPLFRTAPSVAFYQGQTTLPPRPAASPSVLPPFTPGAEPNPDLFTHGFASEEQRVTSGPSFPPTAQVAPLTPAGDGGSTAASKSPVYLETSGGRSRPRPRFGRGKNAAVPSLSSVPGLSALPPSASAPPRWPADAAAGTSAATKPAAAHGAGGASSAPTIGSKSVFKGGKASVGVAVKKSKAAATAAKVARARALQARKASTDHAAAANESTSNAVMGLLSLSDGGSNVEDLVKKTIEKQEKTIQTLAKAVCKLQMDSSKATASTPSVPLATGGLMQVAPELGEVVQAEPSHKRHKAAASVAVLSSPRVSTHDTDVSTRAAVPELRIPPRKLAGEVSSATATAAAKTLAKATAIAQKRADGSVAMVAIRDRLTPKIKAIMGNAQKTMDVLPSPNIRQSIINATAMAVMHADEKTIDEFLLESVHSPSKKRKRLFLEPEQEHDEAPKKIKTVGVNSTLMQVFHHVLGNYKRNVVAGWFKEATKKVPAEMTVSEAGYWCTNNNFFQQPLGRKGVITGVANGLKYLGAPNRIHHPVGAGGEIEVDMCYGHFFLGTQLISEVLTSIRDNVSDQPAIDSMRYKKYVAQAVRHDAFLPKHNKPDRGLILVDGHDPSRAVFEQEFMPASTVLAGDAPLADAASNEGAAHAFHDEAAANASGNGAAADVAGNGAAADVAGNGAVADVAGNGAVADVGGNRAPAEAAPVVAAAPAVAAAAVNIVAPLPPQRAPAGTAAPHAQTALATRQARAAAILAAAQAEAAALLSIPEESA